MRDEGRASLPGGRGPVARNEATKQTRSRDQSCFTRYVGSQQAAQFPKSRSFRPPCLAGGPRNDNICRTIDKAKISEIFSSVQGEGIYVGQRQILVRFNGCNLRPRCAFCDTPISGRPMLLSAQELIKKVHRLNGSGRILKKAGRIYRSVSLTGGEPLCQALFLMEFLPRLKDFTIYLETNGTLPVELKKVIEFIDIIAMDMKLPSSARGASLWDEHKDFLKIANEKRVFVKAVVTDRTEKSDVAKAIEIIEGVSRSIPLVLQPVTPCQGVKRPGPQKVFEFQNMAAGHLFDVRIIPQVHKIVGMR